MSQRQLKTIRRATSVGQFPRIFTVLKFTGRIHFQNSITVGYQLMLQKTFKTRLPLSAISRGEDLMEYCLNELWQPLSGQALGIGKYENHLPDSADIWTQASQDGPVIEFNRFVHVDPYTIFNNVQRIRQNHMHVNISVRYSQEKRKGSSPQKKNTPLRLQTYRMT